VQNDSIEPLFPQPSLWFRICE